MTQLGEAMNDLSKGVVPITIGFSMLSAALLAGYWFGGRTVNTDFTASSLSAQVTRLETQVNGLASQVQSLSLALARGPATPETVALKSDLYKFCLENREIKCPSF
jgi:outer membrane murein-binding lipoprotein Lpp